MILNEQWRVIKDFPDYEVSTMGRVRRIITIQGGREGHILKPGYTQDGYKMVILTNNKYRKTLRIGRLVLETFKNAPEFGDEADHIDGKRYNDVLDNLRWVTRGENIKHAHELGNKSNLGDKNPNVKLTNKQVIEIKKLLADGRLRQVDIAKLYGITRSNVFDIKSGRKWSHIN